MFLKSFLLVISTVFGFWMFMEDNFSEEIVQGRNVLITGASSGIGENIAYHYSRLGANVFITARREDLLKQVVEKCKQLNKKGLHGYYAFDMADYTSHTKQLIQEAVKTMGGLDTVIINHGRSDMRVWYGTDQDLNTFEQLMAVNFRSYVHVASHALPHLKHSPAGKMCAVTSLWGKFATPLHSVYNSAKFALDGFFSSLRLEQQHANTNISISTAPYGPVVTNAHLVLAEFHKKLQSRPEDFVRSSEPIMGTASDAAYQMLRGTEMGKSEIYFPYWCTSVRLIFPSSFAATLRNILSDSWMIFAEYSQHLYDKYDNLLKEGKI